MVAGDRTCAAAQQHQQAGSHCHSCWCAFSACATHIVTCMLPCRAMELQLPRWQQRHRKAEALPHTRCSVVTNSSRSSSRKQRCSSSSSHDSISCCASRSASSCRSPAWLACRRLSCAGVRGDKGSCRAHHHSTPQHTQRRGLPSTPNRSKHPNLHLLTLQPQQTRSACQAPQHVTRGWGWVRRQAWQPPHRLPCVACRPRPRQRRATEHPGDVGALLATQVLNRGAPKHAVPAPALSALRGMRRLAGSRRPLPDRAASCFKGNRKSSPNAQPSARLPSLTTPHACEP